MDHISNETKQSKSPKTNKQNNNKKKCGSVGKLLAFHKDLSLILARQMKATVSKQNEEKQGRLHPRDISQGCPVASTPIHV